MELHRIKILLRTLHAGYRAGVCMCSDAEARRHLCNVHAVAHPAYGLRRNALKQLGGSIHIHFCVSVFADHSLLYNAVQQVAHKLGTVADSKNRYSQLKYLL